MPDRRAFLSSVALLGAGASGCSRGTERDTAGRTRLTIATVNNAEMITLKSLSRQFEARNPDVTLDWVVLEENTLRERTTTDVAAGGGQFDILTLGMYEAPIWGRRGWLARVDEGLPDGYDLDDVIRPIRDGLSLGDKLYALPFVGESSFTYYRKDLFDRAGLSMPAHPRYEDIARFARTLHDPASGVYGITVRGKAGWGENMGYISTLVNTFGGRWFDPSWRPELDSPEWGEAITFYVDLLRSCGPPGSSSNGHNECRALFANGQAAIWIDTTSAAGYLSDPSQSRVAGKVAYADAPTARVPNGNKWLWSWALGIPSSSRHKPEARRFIAWATSKEYIKLVAAALGWRLVPPGTRKSTYGLPEYLEVSPFGPTVLRAIMSVDTAHPTARPVPYRGIQFVAIPEFPIIGTQVGQQMASAVAGSTRVEDALGAAQSAVRRTMRRAGYPRKA